MRVVPLGELRRRAGRSSASAARTILVFGTPLKELLVTREHGIDQLIEHVLGRLAQEVGRRVQGLVVLAIESGAVLHELPTARRGLINGMVPPVLDEDYNDYPDNLH